MPNARARLVFPKGKRKLFTVSASVISSNRDGARTMKQVPSFILDADTHGLFIREDAERLAITMIRDLVDDPDMSLGVNATAEEVSR